MSAELVLDRWVSGEVHVQCLAVRTIKMHMVYGLGGRSCYRLYKYDKGNPLLSPSPFPHNPGRVVVCLVDVKRMCVF